MDISVKRIRPSDYELSTVQDNLADPVDQLLAKANGTANNSQIILSPKLQQLYGAGTPYSIQAPALQVNGDLQNTGGTSVVIGTPATATTSQLNANTIIYGSVNIFGPVTSANGFKSILNVGGVWGSSITEGVFYQTQQVVYNYTNNGFGGTPFVMKWQYAGSVVGYSVNNAGANAGPHYLQVNKNGTQVFYIEVGYGANNATFWGTMNKGTYAFAAGDTMTVAMLCATPGNAQYLTHLTLEMSA